MLVIKSADSDCEIVNNPTPKKKIKLGTFDLTNDNPIKSDNFKNENPIIIETKSETAESSNSMPCPICNKIFSTSHIRWKI